MIKQNKWKLLITSLIIFLPTFVGLILWDVLPASMPTHWNANGQVDGWGSKLFAVLWLPCIMLITHWICILVTYMDPKNKGQNSKSMNLVFWIGPSLSLITAGITYATALDKEISFDLFMPTLFGLLFLLFGNYMPKILPNQTLGIRVFWTLRDEENWKQTHRFGGKVWVIGGLVCLFSICLPNPWMYGLFLTATLAICIIPIVYSYLLYRKKKQEGTSPIPAKEHTLSSKISLAILGVTLVLVAVTLFTGDIRIFYEDSAFTIKATYWTDMAVDYQDIDSIEYRETDDLGSRTSGFGSPKLSMGYFENDEFNSYLRYSYTQCKSCIVLHMGNQVLVINGKNPEDTQNIYNELLQHISE